MSSSRKSGNKIRSGRESLQRKTAPGGPASRQKLVVSDCPSIYWFVSLLSSAVLFIWMFGSVVEQLADVWNSEQDYSHGFLVAPFAVLILWCRRDTFPSNSVVPGYGGLLLIAIGFAARYLSERFFLTPLSSWAFVIWLGGAVWLIAGRSAFLWAAPGLLFLFFMVPLPFRIEQMMSWRLQTITTGISTFAFQCLGIAAVAEGHQIHLGDHILEVEQACSGLRMFMGIAAVAFVFIVLHRRSWWETVIVVLAVAPVSMISNATRVVVTGLLMQRVSGDAAAKFSHDAAGWLMIVVAALLFGFLVAYLKRLFIAVEVVGGQQLLHRPIT